METIHNPLTTIEKGWVNSEDFDVDAFAFHTHAYVENHRLVGYAICEKVEGKGMELCLLEVRKDENKLGVETIGKILDSLVEEFREEEVIFGECSGNLHAVLELKGATFQKATGSDGFVAFKLKTKEHPDLFQ